MGAQWGRTIGVDPVVTPVALLVIVSRVTAVTPPFLNPPLALTVLEIRYPELSGGFEEETLHVVRQAVRGRLPLHESQTDDQVEVTPGAPAPVSVKRRPVLRFSSRDRTTALLVKQDALAIETTAYAGWSQSFRPLVEEATRALGDANPPDGVERIGLRYIDEIRVRGVGEKPGDWKGYINEHLLAAAHPDMIPSGMQAQEWQGVVRYRTSASSTLVVRYGPQWGHAADPAGPTRRKNPPPPGHFFLLDRDIARVVGVSTPALRKWRLGGTATGENRRRVATLVAFCDIAGSRFSISDVACWLEAPLDPQTPLTGLDLMAGGRFDLVLQLVRDRDPDPQAVLDEFEPNWRDRYSSPVEVFTGPDGLPGLRLADR